MPDAERCEALRTHTRASAYDARRWLVVYAIMLALIVFWPVPVDSGAGGSLRAVTRLIPALTYARIEFGANVVMFVPLGVLLTVIIRRERWLVLPIAVLTTLTIESVQAVALPARTASALDIIANTAGACLGMLAVAVAEHVARRARAARRETLSSSYGRPMP